MPNGAHVVNKKLIDKTIEVIGVPSDLGANIRGANMGPAAIRIAKLKGKNRATRL